MRSAAVVPGMWHLRPAPRHYKLVRNNTMLDIVSAIATVALFALSIAYVHGCDHLKGARP